MGPRLVERGKASLAQNDGPSGFGASMGPRLVERGKWLILWQVKSEVFRFNGAALG